MVQYSNSAVSPPTHNRHTHTLEMSKKLYHVRIVSFNLFNRSNFHSLIFHFCRPHTRQRSPPLRHPRYKHKTTLHECSAHWYCNYYYNLLLFSSHNFRSRVPCLRSKHENKHCERAEPAKWFCLYSQLVATAAESALIFSNERPAI
jgi:hypothetical protein